jgi:hypothetical protein
MGTVRFVEEGELGEAFPGEEGEDIMDVEVLHLLVFSQYFFFLELFHGRL